jgi:hypothetical protein
MSDLHVPVPPQKRMGDDVAHVLRTSGFGSALRSHFCAFCSPAPALAPGAGGTPRPTHQRPLPGT